MEAHFLVQKEIHTFLQLIVRGIYLEGEDTENTLLLLNDAQLFSPKSLSASLYKYFLE